MKILKKILSINPFDLHSHLSVTYGPCQSPTLWFCVQRHDKIATFGTNCAYVYRDLIGHVYCHVSYEEEDTIICVYVYRDLIGHVY